MITARPVADERVLRGTVATVHAVVCDQDGDADANAAAATITVRNGAGEAIVTDDPTDGADGAFAYTLAADATAQLDVLTAAWSVDGAVRAVNLIEVVGGFYFSVAEARAADSTFTNQNFTDAQIRTARREVEDEFERICAVAFVPRYRRALVAGTGTPALMLPDARPRVVTAAAFRWGGTTSAPVGADAVAALVCDASGTVRRFDHAIWPANADAIDIAYEHGYDRPPPDVKRAAISRLRQRLNIARSAAPERAARFVATDQATIRLATADATHVGDDDIDGVLARYSYRVGIA